MARAHRVARCAFALAAATRALPAQTGTPLALRPLARLDVLAARVTAVQAGVGADLALGTYTRLEAVAAGGVVGRRGAAVGSARVDAVVRLLLDPFRESRVGPYAVAGVSGRADGPTRHAYLVLLAGVEGPVGRRVATAVEAGVGGGIRVGLVVRAAAPDRR